MDTWTQTAEPTEYDIVSTKIALGITKAVEEDVGQTGGDGVIADSTGERGGDASQETNLKTLVGREVIRCVRKKLEYRSNLEYYTQNIIYWI